MLLGLESQSRSMVPADENENMSVSSSHSEASSVRLCKIFHHANENDSSSTTVSSFMVEHRKTEIRDTPVTKAACKTASGDQVGTVNASALLPESSPPVPSKQGSPHENPVSAAMKVVQCIMVFFTALQLLMRNLTDWWRRYRRRRPTRDQVDLENGR